jgi:hypothetical protein
MESSMNTPNLAVAVEFHILLLTLVASWVILVLKPGQRGVAMALFAGSITAFVDVHSSEVQLPALMLVGFGSMIGVQAGKRRWTNALILGIFVPAAHLTQVVLGTTDSGRLAGALGSFASLAFALLGVGVGALIEKIGESTARRKCGRGKQEAVDQSSLP